MSANTMAPPSRNTRSQNAPADDSSESSSLRETSLHKDTPAWGISMFNLLNSTLSSLDEKVVKCNNTIDTLANIKATAEEALETAQQCKNLVDSLSVKVENLTEALEFVLCENQKQKEHIWKNESYSRRENLIFRGFTVSRNDQESSETKVRNIIKSMGIQQSDRIPFVRCHYLREQKQIIVRFQWFADRERIWRNRYKLKNSNFYVAEDFPPEIEAQRRQLYPILKAAKFIPEFQNKVTMNAERLVLNGKRYTCKNIHEIVPLNIHPRTLAQKSNDQVLVFGGSTSRHHWLSNFSNVKDKFVYEHIQYSTVEQAFQHKKAREAGDQNKQREILFNPDPAIQKQLGHEVQGIDIANWNDKKRSFMKDILIAKFTQKDDLLKLLLETGEKTLAEANGRDSYFGIGLPLTHPDVLNPEKWAENSNHLGQVLMEIRQELRSE